jgi:NADP-dependent 3-hydroxy acid dehydrogenase YdfG
MSNDIEGKVVVITGASRGPGEAMARFSRRDHRAGCTRQDRLKALAETLGSAGGKALTVTTDVTDPAQVKRLVDAAVQTFGRVDVMINNAGLMPQALL